jgi:hypothetical protein
MRQSISFCAVVFCAVVLLSALSAAQVTVTSGYASDWTPPPGLYATPFVPLVTTPGLALGSAPLQVGASNATAGNVAGAADATLSIDTSGPSARFAQPVWYGQAISSQPEEEETGSAEAAGSQIKQGFEFGTATFQSSYGVAQLAAEQRPRGRAQRVYTNADIARLDEANGLVKLGGKTERME